jgi:bifunctional non-homologous end joining protein LigD
VARLLQREHPNEVVSDMKKALRVGKVLVDWSQNDDHKTTVCVYSMRAKDRPTVSTPVSWDEVERTAEKEDHNLLVFAYDQTLKRAEQMGDLFEPVLKLKQKLPPMEALRALRLDQLQTPVKGTLALTGVEPAARKARTTTGRTPRSTTRRRKTA